MRVSVWQDGCRYRRPGKPFLDVTSLGAAELDIFAARICYFLGSMYDSYYLQKGGEDRLAKRMRIQEFASSNFAIVIFRASHQKFLLQVIKGLSLTEPSVV